MYLQKLGIILYIILRGILSVFRIIPFSSLYRELTILPIKIALDSCTETAAIYLYRLDI